MLKQLLEQQNKRLRICIELHEEQPLDVKLTNDAGRPDEMLRFINGEQYKAYYLPWREDSGLYVDLPKVRPSGPLFLTANLSGCFIGVQNFKDFIRIKHYNFQDNCTRADLERYGEVKWLLPLEEKQRLYPDKDIATYTYPKGPKDFATFWGELESGVWKFYYQGYDKSIHPFHY